MVGIQKRAAREPATHFGFFADAAFATPAADIFETADHLTIFIDIPGVSPENVDLDFQDDILSIWARKDKIEDSGEFLLHEYDSGDYFRNFCIGFEIDTERARASLGDGVLMIVLPKFTEGSRKVIPVGDE
ncbi:Hsp20/alpha crystallin family protein [Desulfomonile tiedjei]|uniref:Molecular chaperone (Small heat shock protein) n=1 Tax=Desulfomonile tiedjei (strain ATCC 49306 / DSM 6799 / DCB-1) TaxID=706587 RepID=I4C2V8_DESTA|nr:Hsp20/alpha crystallin family protein [Desulfomonile tiedjei]AFM23899.1 molecular chaperone (small heat shock protein) [Desulfomonile tiedjei DSM 6799]